MKDNNLERLALIKEKIDSLKHKKAALEGKKEQLEKQIDDIKKEMKEKWDVDNIDDLKLLIQQWESEVSELLDILENVMGLGDE